MAVLATPAALAATGPRTSAGRRTAVSVTGFLACVVPVVFAVNLTRMLLVGELSSHRFHQLTGQGLLLLALWLGGLVPQLRDGWAGRTPSPRSALLHLSFVATGVACTVAAPLGGAPFLLGLVVVTGLLVQAALPARARLRHLELRVAPAALTASLVLAAVVAPYVVDQLRLQHAATGHHAANPHYFDMAWLVATLVVLALVAACVVQARSLLLWAAGGVLLTGAAMVALDQGTGTGGAFLVTGAALLVAQVVDRGRRSAEPVLADPTRG